MPTDRLSEIEANFNRGNWKSVEIREILKIARALQSDLAECNKFWVEAHDKLLWYDERVKERDAARAEEQRERVSAYEANRLLEQFFAERNDARAEAHALRVALKFIRDNRANPNDLGCTWAQGVAEAALAPRRDHDFNGDHLSGPSRPSGTAKAVQAKRADGGSTGAGESPGASPASLEPAAEAPEGPDRLSTERTCWQCGMVQGQHTRQCTEGGSAPKPEPEALEFTANTGGYTIKGRLILPHCGGTGCCAEYGRALGCSGNHHCPACPSRGR